MPKDIKQRIILEGEKEYSGALKNAKRNLGVLRSELKAETAELGANATAQEKNRVKAKNLQKQIAEQTKIVDTYREALEEVRGKYGDNADAVARYERQLNDARTALANMRNQLEQTGASYSSITTGAKQSVVENNALAESFGRISEAAGNMADKMETAFTKAVGIISQAISSVWSELMEVAEKSDKYMDLSEFLGASPTEVQKWSQAMKDAGGNFSTITSLIAKFKYGGKADKVTEWFGISGVNYTNDLQYAQDVLQQMYDMKDEMVRNGTWGTAMSEIFGAKKVEEVDGVLSDWDNILRRLEYWDVDNGGKGFTQEEIEKMDSLGQKVRELKSDWEYLKENFTVKLFGDIAVSLTGNAQGAVEALIEFMDADTQEEREAAIEKFQENITEAFTQLGLAIAAAGEALEKAGSEMQNSENGWVKLLGDLLVSLGNAMEWIADEGNLEKVKRFFEVMFGIWAAGNVVAAVSNLAKLASSFTTISSSGKIISLLNQFGNNGGNGTGTGTGVGAGGNQTVTSQTVTNGTVTNQTVTNGTVTNGTVTNQTVTNGTVTNQTVTNGTVTNGTVTNGTVTNATVTSMQVPNEAVATSNVTTMYVASMITGTPIPGGGDTGGNPVISNDGSGGRPALPYSSPTTPALDAGNGFNGYVPINIGTGGGGDLLIDNSGGGDLYLGGGDGTPTLPGGEGSDLIRLPDGDWNISGDNTDGQAAAEALEALVGSSWKGKAFGGTVAFLYTLLDPAGSSSDEEGAAWKQRKKELRERELEAMDVLERTNAEIVDEQAEEASAAHRAEVLYTEHGVGNQFGKYDGEDGYWTPEHMQWVQDMYQARINGDGSWTSMYRYLANTMPEEDWATFSKLFSTFMSSGRWRAEDMLPLDWWSSDRQNAYNDWYTNGGEFSQDGDWWKQPYEEREVRGKYYFDDELKQATEEYWDLWKKGEDFDAIDEQYDKLLELLGGDETIMDELWRDMSDLDKDLEDLPAAWWGEQTDGDDGISGMNQVMRGLPKEIAGSLSNVKVVMDGQTVGYLVTPYVSQKIAQEAG